MGEEDLRVLDGIHFEVVLLAVWFGICSVLVGCVDV